VSKHVIISGAVEGMVDEAVLSFGDIAIGGFPFSV